MLNSLILLDVDLLLDTLNCASVTLKCCTIDRVESARYLDIHFYCSKYFTLSTKECIGDF